MNLDMLTEQQREAVLTTEGPLLILAGAGSGKTRVLTYRTAYLIDECGVNPYNIMAITFTNKAAGEMRERIDDMVGYGSESIWVSTFHSTCVRILRRYIDRLGYDTNFTIYDADDQKALMKDICKRLEIDTKMYKEKMFLNVISSAKDEMIDPIEFENRFTGDFVKRKQALVYKEYQNALKQNNALDFDDLLVKTVELFKLDKEVLDYYQERFRYIMVDEYQDTNNAQFELIRLLASKYRNLCVVGDDDQSIYKFRGANIRNILDYEKVYPDAKVIKLEQNYRSTQNILDAANAIIRHNSNRLGKNLWTDQGAGEPIRVFEAFSDGDEARWIVEEIQSLVRDGALRSEIATIDYDDGRTEYYHLLAAYHAPGEGPGEPLGEADISGLGRADVHDATEDEASVVEFVRVPDADLGYLAFGRLTMGQVLSLPLIALGLFLFWKSRSAPTLQPVPPAATVDTK